MLRAVNTEKNVPYLQRYGIPALLLGSQYSQNNKPIDFQYAASEVVTKFEAVKIDLQGNIIEAITLSTSLVVLSSGRHICNGQTDFASNLTENIYYFNINDKYHTEIWQVDNEIIDISDLAIPDMAVGTTFIIR